MAIDVRNTLHYRETKVACAAWLKDKLGEATFHQIDKLAYMGKVGYVPTACQMWVRPCKTKWKNEAREQIRSICNKQQ